MGELEDVVEAGTRLMVDTRVSGRALVVGPKAKVNDELAILPKEADVKETAIWELYANDFEEVEAFSARFVRMLNSIEKIRGWVGWASDVVAAIGYPLRNWWSP